jgi:enediyne biosynthesis protein E5
MTAGTGVSPHDVATDPHPGWTARFFSPQNRYLPPLVITLILLVGQISFGLLESLPKTLLAISASLATEAVLSLAFTKRLPHFASAYISGISVGILVRSPEAWPYVLCSAIAITSKYVIRWRGRHLWNPSNFAISAMLILAPEYVATLSIQWGNTLWPMLIVWVLGALIVIRAGRFHITGTYVLSFIALAFGRSLITGHPFLAEVAPITGPMYQLFIFFMITDPKTTVKPRWAQCLVALLVAVVEMVLRLTENIHAPYYALAIVGPLANAIEIALAPRRKGDAIPAAPLRLENQAA